MHPFISNTSQKRMADASTQSTQQTTRETQAASLLNQAEITFVRETLDRNTAQDNKYFHDRIRVTAG